MTRTGWPPERVREGTLIGVRLANATKDYANATLTPDQKRKMSILLAGMVIPAPSTGTPEEQKKISRRAQHHHDEPAVDLRARASSRSMARS